MDEMKKVLVSSVADNLCEKNKIQERIDEDDNLKKILLKLSRTDKTISNSYSNILSYLNDKKSCVDCHSFFLCPKGERKGFNYRLVYSPFSDSLELSVAYCPKYSAIKAVLSNIIYSDIDPFSTYVTFMEVKKAKNLSSSDSPFVSAVATEAQLIDDFDCLGKYYVDSTSNSSYLLRLLAFYYAKSKKKVAIIQAERTFVGLESSDSISKELNQTSFSRALESDVLFIIDIGAEFKTSAFRDQVLIPMLISRNSLNKKTYFCSSFSINELVSIYAKKDINIKAKLFALFQAVTEEKNISDYPFF